MRREDILLFKEINIPFFRRRRFNASRFVIFGFALMILVGTLLLQVPFATRSGEGAGFATALFTSTAATCVTGLTVADTWSTWSFFGQVVILGMVQLGGLGFMTAITMISFLLHRKISMSERLVIVSTLNLQDMDGVVRVVRHALFGTLVMEGAGAVVLSACFIPEFGFWSGLWKGIFHSVSAFCNAGFDLMGSHGAYASLMPYAHHPVVLLTTILLIVVGGIGFFVWEDIYQCRCWKKLTFYTKLVLGTTALLIVSGGIFFFCVEYENSATLGSMQVWQKALNALFQSVTLRTAGFASVDQAGLSESAKIVSVLLMLIGGSSGSTAGGLKTGTVAILLLALWAGLKGREQVTFRGRSIPSRQVTNAMTLVGMVGTLFLVSSIVMSLAEKLPFVTASFEVASAMGTTGLTQDLTPVLSPFSKGMVIVLMFLGRIGILSVSIAFMTRGKHAAKIKYPAAGVIIG